MPPAAPSSWSPAARRPGRHAIGFSAHRPPGHHALPARAMGFCLFNNVAVAATCPAGARARTGPDPRLGRPSRQRHQRHLPRIRRGPVRLDPPVAAVPGHRPRRRRSGPAAGAGYTVNLPVPAGTGDAVFVSLVGTSRFPLALAFEPQLVLISAGFDAHRDDPLASCAVTEEGSAGWRARSATSARARRAGRLCARGRLQPRRARALGRVDAGGARPGVCARSRAGPNRAALSQDASSRGASPSSGRRCGAAEQPRG